MPHPHFPPHYYPPHFYPPGWGPPPPRPQAPLPEPDDTLTLPEPDSEPVTLPEPAPQPHIPPYGHFGFGKVFILARAKNSSVCGGLPYPIPSSYV